MFKDSSAADEEFQNHEIENLKKNHEIENLKNVSPLSPNQHNPNPNPNLNLDGQHLQSQGNDSANVISSQNHENHGWNDIDLQETPVCEEPVFSNRKSSKTTHKTTHKTPNRVLENTLGNHTSQQRTVGLALQSVVSSMLYAKQYGSDLTKRTLDSCTVYLNKYPTLKTFAYTSVALSALPVAVFSAFVGVSLCVSIFTAVMGVVLVQSGVIFVGLSVLVPIEAGAFFIAGAVATVGNITGWDKKLLSYHQSSSPSSSRPDHYQNRFIKEFINDADYEDEMTTIIS